MDKLQSEYEALQQKLALLKRDSSTAGGSKGPQSTPLASIQAPRLPAPADAAAAGAPGTAAAEPPSGAPPDSTMRGAAAAGAASSGLRSMSGGSFGGGGDTGPLSFSGLSMLQSCENLQLHCSLPDASGVLQSLKFAARHQGSRLAGVAEAGFSDPEFVQLCEQGLTAQLQRTRDGATTQSRITELAGKGLVDAALAGGRSGGLHAHRQPTSAINPTLTLCTNHPGAPPPFRPGQGAAALHA
jgi:hypothetical protein